LEDSRKAWLYATGIMLAVSLTVLVLRLLSRIFFTLDFELALVYVPTLVLIGISIYLKRRCERSPR